MRIACTLLFPVCLAAQTTWIVDAAAGPGSNFTNLGPAVLAASAGDTILIRSGSYMEGAIIIDQGITILGIGNVSIDFSTFLVPGILVQDIPAGQAFVLRNVRAHGVFTDPDVLASNCQGTVLIDDIEGTLGQFGVPVGPTVRFEDCAQVHLHATFVRGGGSVRFTRSHGTLSNCVIEGQTGTALFLADADLTIDGCTVDVDAQPFFIGSPILLDHSALQLTRSTVSVPVAAFGSAAAIGATQSTVRLDPTTTLTPSIGEPPIAGTATVSNVEVVSLTRSTHPQSVTFDLHGRGGAIFATIVSLPTGVVDLPWGDVWVDLGYHAQLPIDLGVFTQRQHLLTIATTPLPTGLTLVVQAGVLDSELTLSNGIGYVVP